MEVTVKILVLLWIAAGWAAHIDYCLRNKTWCGVPIWREPTTYIMFGPAAIVGPLLWLQDDNGNLRNWK